MTCWVLWRPITPLGKASIDRVVIRCMAPGARRNCPEHEPPPHAVIRRAWILPARIDAHRQIVTKSADRGQRPSILLPSSPPVLAIDRTHVRAIDRLASPQGAVPAVRPDSDIARNADALGVASLQLLLLSTNSSRPGNRLQASGCYHPPRRPRWPPGPLASPPASDNRPQASDASAHVPWRLQRV
jgi:hypothetical protein